MDIDLRRDDEHFPTFDSINFLDPFPDEGTTTDSVQSFTPNDYEWSSEMEQEINGDIALVPVCDMNLTNDASPNVDEFFKILNDWHQFINIDPSADLTLDQFINPKDPEPDLTTEKDLLNSNNFDITEYLNDIDPEKPSATAAVSRKHKAGVKKIDLQARRYIIDEEEEVDVETVSECEENSPVLEAKDLNSLLEQFEATQLPHLTDSFIKTEPIISESIPCDIFEERDDAKKDETETKDSILDSVIVKQEIIEIEEHPLKHEDHEYACRSRKGSDRREKKRKSKNSSKETGKEIIPSTEIKTEQASPAPLTKRSPKSCSTPKHDENTSQFPAVPYISKLEVPSQTAETQLEPSREMTDKLVEMYPDFLKRPAPVQKPQETITKPSTCTPPNKQIADSLPPELIARIKESGKRKTISVIDPIPTRKRGYPRTQDVSSQPPRKKINKLSAVETVQLDHSYCSVGSVEPYPKIPMKDSGFESAEEDDRTVIGTQPTVKNADGKLMVSLLKVNTILPNKTNEKKKLNLEEYKKRRQGFIKSQNNSLNCSPNSSTCSSPLPEDETTRLLKHQEKLKRMAREVLNTPPKREKKEEPVVFIPRPEPLPLPANLEKKEIVSIGVNTDFKMNSKLIDPLAPVERLHEIKPLLQKASAKINCNSLITSVIENIPKVIDSCDPTHKRSTTNQTKFEHGEDKVIHFIEKNREVKQTVSVECQTNISLIQQTKASRYRRRHESHSSTSSWSSEDSRTSSRLSRRYERSRISNDSRCSSSSKSSRSSKSSTYSSRSSSRSRSRSSSPKYSRRERERLKEVEERRVIYVGRVASGTTKDDLRKRFQRFGPITNISLHSRDHSYLDNYGFVTFANKLDAYEAIEHGNDDPWQPKYDLSFGGRRIFCQTSYSDLDNMRDEGGGYFSSRGSADDSFDKLLREAQEKMRKRKA